MAITVRGYSFDGPYTSKSSIKNESGVYAIHDHNNEKYYIIDVGESGEIASRLDNHEREDCWNKEKNGNLTFSALYVTEQEREKIEQEIRSQYNVPCGER